VIEEITEIQIKHNAKLQAFDKIMKQKSVLKDIFYDLECEYPAPKTTFLSKLSYKCYKVRKFVFLFIGKILRIDFRDVYEELL